MQLEQYAKKIGLNPESPLAAFGYKLSQAQSDQERVALLSQVNWIPVSTEQEAVWLGRVRENLISLQNELQEAA